MKRRLDIFVLVFYLPLTLSKPSEGSPRCCDAGIQMIDEYKCVNGKNISLACEGYVELLRNEYNPYKYFSLGRNSKGWYLMDDSLGFRLREPDYCTGKMNDSERMEIISVAAICSSKRIRKNEIIDDKLQSVHAATEIIYQEYYMFLLRLFNTVSSLASAFTSLVYYILPQRQDVDKQCIFHLTLNLCLLHASVAYYLFNTDGSLPDLCITKLYVGIYSLTSTSIWFLILGFHTWNKCRSCPIKVPNTKLMFRYRLVGYGVPAFFILLVNMHAHWAKLYTSFGFELNCQKHQWATFVITIFPWICFQIFNVFFVLYTQHRLARLQSISSNGEETLTLKTLKSQLKLIVKLFVIMHLPGLTFSLVGWMLYISKQWMAFTIWLLSMVLVFSAQGLFIFLITVIFQKRVCRGLHRQFRTVRLQRRKPLYDMEELTESDLDSENGDAESLSGKAVPKRSYSIHFSNAGFVQD